MPVVLTALCSERKFGAIEGLTWDQVQQLPVMMIKVGHDLHTVNPKGGEPLEKVWLRAQAFRSFLLKNYCGAHVLVISHGVFLQMFHGLLRGLTCIESLASYPGNLEVRQFTLRGLELVREVPVEAERLGPIRW